MQLHIDTDLGGDPDDACAVAMLLGWPGVEITGVTTVLDRTGRRAGMVRRLLEVAGRHDIPVASGAQVSLTTLGQFDPHGDDVANWGRVIEPDLAPPGGALDLLRQSIDAGATVLAIGPQTNLAMLEVARAGTLARARVVAMGGWVDPPEEGYPDWGPDMDWNIQCDPHAARIVARTAQLTLATLPVTLKTHLREAHLPRLRSAGPLGELLARQAVRRAAELGFARLAAANSRLPADLLNFHYDPLACAVGAGWEGVRVEEMSISAVVEGSLLRYLRDADGRATNVLVDVDGAAFESKWLECVERAGAARPAP